LLLDIPLAERLAQSMNFETSAPWMMGLLG
jgi:hypothetical protein